MNLIAKFLVISSSLFCFYLFLNLLFGVLHYFKVVIFNETIYKIELQDGVILLNNYYLGIPFSLNLLIILFIITIFILEKNKAVNKFSL